jgi:dCTP deaminase
MSVLARSELIERLRADLPNRLVITPLLDERQLGPASIDLRLGTDFLVLRRTERAGFDPQKVDVDAPQLHDRFVVPLGQGLWLHPDQFLLGSTLEFVRVPADLAGFLTGRSSWARLGLIVETAGLVQPNYSGTLTYELANAGDSPIRLYPGLRVAQLAIHPVIGEASVADVPQYESKYRSAVGPEASRLAWDDDELAKVLSVGESLH